MIVEPAAALEGHIAVPGDKSISHRAVLLGALGEGETQVTGWGRSGDTESTVAAMRALGVRVDEPDTDELVVEGRGIRGLRAGDGPVDCGNAGTLLRLLAGILAGQEGRFELTGDESLRSRPMERIAEPLRRMGATVHTTEGRPPIVIEGSARLAGIEYPLPVASAQVKSAVLLAGLNAEGSTTVLEPAPTRDHTELMLEAAGVRVRRRPSSVTVEPARELRLPEVRVPGDFSSAAPFVVAATLLAGSDVTIHGVGVNPRRTGLLDALERMGAHLAIFNRRREAGEAVGDLNVQHAELVGTNVDAAEVPRLVDELPLLALAACYARGETRVAGAAELRVKETDRIEAVVDALRAIGARIVGTEDGFRITGVPRRLRGGSIEARGDHRIAMLGAIAGLVSRDGVTIMGAESVSVSFPGFFELLESVRR